MARPKDPELEARRQRAITDAVIELLSEESWQTTTLTRVAKRAGVSRGVVTYWFDSKDDLIVASIERFHSQYESDLSAIAMQPVPLRERLEALILAAFPDRQTVARDVRFQIEVWSYAKEHPDVGEQVLTAWRTFRGALQMLLALGVEQGEISAPQGAALAADVHAYVDGISLHLAMDPEMDIEDVRQRILARLDTWFTA